MPRKRKSVTASIQNGQRSGGDRVVKRKRERLPKNTLAASSIPSSLPVSGLKLEDLTNKFKAHLIGDQFKVLNDMEKVLKEISEKIMNWQVVAQAVEAYAILLWQEPLAIPKSTKMCLKKLYINDVLQLRFQSQLHHNNDERDDITQFASDAYNKIPIHYRNVLDELIRNKARRTVDRTIVVAHPVIHKSQIITFLAAHFTQQNAATDLLRKVPNLEVLDMDGRYVSMFQEG